MNPIAAEILVQATVLILEIGFLIACGVGVILIIRPAIIATWNSKLNKWYSTRRFLRVFEMVHDTDPWFLKNHRIYGLFMLIVSIILLYFMLFVTTPPSAYESMLTPLNQDQYLVLKFLYYFLLLAIMIGILVWVLLIFAPQVLARIMPTLNQWISTRMMLRKVDEVNSRYDDFVLRHPKTFGTLFIVFGLTGFFLTIL